MLDSLHSSWSSKSESGSCSLAENFSEEVARPQHPHGYGEVADPKLHRVWEQDNLGRRRGTTIITFQTIIVLDCFSGNGDFQCHGLCI